jgi:hypothetical protein
MGNALGKAADPAVALQTEVVLIEGSSGRARQRLPGWWDE